MSVNITHRRMHGGIAHEHIASVRWQGVENAETGTSTREVMVNWIENKGGKAFVRNGGQTVGVGVVKANPPYLRTYADGVWTDNLLALPTF